MGIYREERGSMGNVVFNTNSDRTEVSLRWVYQLRAQVTHTPDSLVGYPSGVTLVQSVLEGGSQLFGRSDGCPGRATRVNGPRKGKGITARSRPVVEHHTWRDRGRRSVCVVSACV